MRAQNVKVFNLLRPSHHAAGHHHRVVTGIGVQRTVGVALFDDLTGEDHLSASSLPNG